MLHGRELSGKRSMTDFRDPMRYTASAESAQNVMFDQKIPGRTALQT